MEIEDQVVRLRAMDPKDAEKYDQAIAFLKARRPILNAGKDAIHYISLARGYYGVPDWRMWIVSVMALITLIASVVVGVKLPVLSLQYRLMVMGVSALLSLPFLYKLNLQKHAKLVHFVGMYATVLGVLVGAYYLFNVRTHTYSRMYLGLFIARCTYNMIPIFRLYLSKADKSSKGTKISVVIAVISNALRITATLAAVVEGVFPIVSYALLVFGVEVIHIIWKEFGVKGSSTSAATLTNFVSGNAAALMVLTGILLLIK